RVEDRGGDPRADQERSQGHRSLSRQGGGDLVGVLLSVEDVHAGYGPIEVLKGISLQVNEGEIVTMIGANGAGKTSTLMCISGVVKARSGRVVFGGRDIHTLAGHEIVKLGLCQSPEGRKVFPRL